VKLKKRKNKQEVRVSSKKRRTQVDARSAKKEERTLVLKAVKTAADSFIWTALGSKRKTDKRNMSAMAASKIFLNI